MVGYCLKYCTKSMHGGLSLSSLRHSQAERERFWNKLAWAATVYHVWIQRNDWGINA